MAPRKGKRKLQTFGSGQVIFREGEKGRFMYLIREGQVRISKKVMDIEKTLDTLRKGDFFGEMALIEDLPRCANATATAPTTVEMIDEDGFLKFVGNGQTMALRMLRDMSSRLREADRQIETLLLKNEEGRVVHTLSSLSLVYGRKKQGVVFLSRLFSVDEIADMANVSVRVARRVLDKLVEGDLISYDDGRITLKSYAALSNFLNYINWRSKAFA